MNQNNRQKFQAIWKTNVENQNRCHCVVYKYNELELIESQESLWKSKFYEYDDLGRCISVINTNLRHLRGAVSEGMGMMSTCCFEYNENKLTYEIFIPILDILDSEFEFIQSNVENKELIYYYIGRKFLYDERWGVFNLL